MGGSGTDAVLVATAKSNSKVTDTPRGAQVKLFDVVYAHPDKESMSPLAVGNGTIEVANAGPSGKLGPRRFGKPKESPVAVANSSVKVRLFHHGWLSKMVL